MEARASDLRKMRKHLSALGLLAVVRAHFERIKELWGGAAVTR